jgi:hypothetical protein
MNENDYNEKPHMDQHVLDLLNAGIDGELSPSEEAELNVFLAGSKEVRDLNEELIAITSLLDQVPDIEPPQYLQSAIERQVRLPVQSQDAALNSPTHNTQKEKQSFFGAWLTTHWLRTGIALAAGVVLTAGVYQMGSHPISAEDASNMVGTVVKGQAAYQGELLSSIHLNTETLSGRVELRNIDSLYKLDIQMNSGGDSVLVVNFAGRGLEFAGVSPERDFEDAVSVANGSINFSGSGEQHFTLKFRRTSEVPQATPLELNFFADNKLVKAAELSILR